MFAEIAADLTCILLFASGIITGEKPMIRISNIHLPLDYTSETVLNKAAKLINVDKKSFFKKLYDFQTPRLTQEKKDNIFFSCNR